MSNYTIPKGMAPLEQGEKIEKTHQIAWYGGEPEPVHTNWIGRHIGDNGFQWVSYRISGWVILKSLKSEQIKTIVAVGSDPNFIKAFIAAIEGVGVSTGWLLDRGDIPRMIDRCNSEVYILIGEEGGSIQVYGRGHKNSYAGESYTDYDRFDARTQFAELIAYLTPKPKKQIAFWKYDLFPYVLSAELLNQIVKGAGAPSYDVKGYGRLLGAPLAIMDEESAVKLQKELDHLTQVKKQNDDSITERLKVLIPWRKL